MVVHGQKQLQEDLVKRFRQLLGLRQQRKHHERTGHGNSPMSRSVVAEEAKAEQDIADRITELAKIGVYVCHVLCHACLRKISKSVNLKVHWHRDWRPTYLRAQVQRRHFQMEISHPQNLSSRRNCLKRSCVVAFKISPLARSKALQQCRNVML